MRKEFLRRQARVCLLATAAALASPAIGLAEPTVDTIAVNVDQAKLVRLPGKVATIVVGNPLIADVTLQPGGMIVVTGKGYGATNFIALDRGGEILVDRQIQVEGPSDRLVTVYRGIERESYSCLPVCQRHARRQRHLLHHHDESGWCAEQQCQRHRGRYGRQDELAPRQTSAKTNQHGKVIGKRLPGGTSVPHRGRVRKPAWLTRS
jgi:hypothetical protein